MSTHDDTALREKIERHLQQNPKINFVDLVRAAYEKSHRRDLERRPRLTEIQNFHNKGIISAHLAAFIRDMKISGEEN